MLILLSELDLFRALIRKVFGLAGYVLITVLSTYAARIQRLYFWDLTGAGIGTVFAAPFILKIGRGGLIACAAVLGLMVAALLPARAPRASAVWWRRRRSPR